MPVKKSAIKALKQDKKKAIKNKKTKDGLSFITRKVRKALADNNVAEAEKWFKTYIKAVDKAAKTGVVKQNTAAQKKSRGMKSINKLKKSGSNSVDKKVK